MSFELILPFLRPIEPLLLDEDVKRNHGQSRRLMVVRTRRHHIAKSRTFPSTPASYKLASKSLPINSARSSTRTTHFCTRNSRTGVGWRQWIPPLVRPAHLRSLRSGNSPAAITQLMI